MFNDKYIIDIASEDLRKAALAVRRQVFVKEQGIPESSDIDQNEGCSIYVLAYIQKRHRILPIGTMRIRSFAGFVEFERMAVIRNFRKTNVAEDIMQYAFDYVAQKGYRKVGAYCKKELLPRWQRSGFYENPEGEIIDQNGMKLIPICRDLPPHPRALTINSAYIKYPEGHWFDKDQEVKVPSKSNTILAKLKELKQRCFNH